MRQIITRRAGLQTGLVAMLLTIGLTYLFRATTSILALSDLLEDRFTSLVPITLFSTVLDTLKFKAKPLLFLGIVAGQLAIGALIGLGYAVYLRRQAVNSEREAAARVVAVRTRDTAIIASAFWLVSELILLPLLGAGLFGRRHQPPLRAFHLALLVEVILFARSLTWLLSREAAVRLKRSLEPGIGMTRRQLLTNSAAGIAAIGLGALVVKSVVFKNKETVGFKTAEGMEAELTPIDDFYQVSKNFVNPTVDVATWKLAIGGLVERPRSLTYDALLASPNPIEQYGTLECISNEVGGDLMSNGIWKGVRLADLLKEAGVKPEAKRLVLTA